MIHVFHFRALEWTLDGKNRHIYRAQYTADRTRQHDPAQCSRKKALAWIYAAEKFFFEKIKIPLDSLRKFRHKGRVRNSRSLQG